MFQARSIPTGDPASLRAVGLWAVTAALVVLSVSPAFPVIGYDDCSHAPETTVCFPYIAEHIHDLGALFPSGTQVKIRYRPGWSPSCDGYSHQSISVDKSSWTEVATEYFSSGHREYTTIITASHSFRYVKVGIPVCYVDSSSAAVYLIEGGVFQPTRTLDFGVSLQAGTNVTLRVTPGWGHGCSGTATISSSNNGSSWTTLKTVSYSTYAAPTPGWRDYKTTVTPESSFRYLRIAHSHCYNDLSIAEVTPWGYREFYAVIIGGQTDQTGAVRQLEPYYTWYWNVTSDMYTGVRTDYLFPYTYVYFLFEEDGFGNLDKDTTSIHDRDATLGNVDEVFDHLSNRLDDDDLLYLFWVGHGNSSSFLLPGTDYTHSHLNTKLNAISGTKVLVLQPCQSGCAIDDLSAPDRIILTSVSCGENNQGPWAETWRDGILGAAPQDGMGHISLASAFEYTAELIQDSNEHPLLDDNGDGVGHRYDDPGYDPGTAGEDGFQAARTDLVDVITAEIFSDGFESGDTTAWSQIMP